MRHRSSYLSPATVVGEGYLPMLRNPGRHVLGTRQPGGGQRSLKAGKLGNDDDREAGFGRPPCSPEELRRLLRYDPESGTLYWLPRDGPGRGNPRFNTMYAGKEALNYVGTNGYRNGSILNRPYDAHRVIWAIVFGAWPTEIDHIDGDRSNNRLTNLRDVTRVENGKNQKLSARNTSGTPGVHWHSRDKTWNACIRRDGTKVHIGSFATLDQAVDARKAAEREFGYHPNHGRVS